MACRASAPEPTLACSTPATLATYASRISRLVALSSTIEDLAGWTASSAGRVAGRGMVGSASTAVNENVEPEPGVAVDADPAAHQLDELREIARPRPVPP